MYVIQFMLVHFNIPLRLQSFYPYYLVKNNLFYLQLLHIDFSDKEQQLKIYEILLPV
jgi:hypothetical protein